MISKTQNAFIFARGGSKGIKDKNIKMLAGKPLIGYAIECGLGSKYINKVTVSTDSPKISQVAKSFGAHVLKRPDELASDQAPEIEAWRHAVRSFQNLGVLEPNDIFISLPATSPLRSSSDVDLAIERFQRSGADILFGVTPSQRNPYLNMVTAKDGLIEVVIPGHHGQRRQDMPDVYDVTSCVYISQLEYILNCERLMEGKVAYSEIPFERSLDIDTPFDFHVAKLLISHPFEG